MAALAVPALIVVPGTAHAATWGTMKNGYGLCLDDTNYSTTAGNQMQVYSCNGKATQAWRVYEWQYAPNNVKVFMFQVEQSGMCLDLFQQTGPAVVQWPCNPSDPGQWSAGDENANGGYNFGYTGYPGSYVNNWLFMQADNVPGNKVTITSGGITPNSAPYDSWGMPPGA